MLEFWEGLNENISYNYDTKVFYYLKPILGVCIECVAIIFCLNYHTIYYAAVLQLISFYLISSSTECLRWIVKFKSKRDYKKIITSNAVLYQYKLNSKLIISIYLLNFISFINIFIYKNNRPNLIYPPCTGLPVKGVHITS